MIVIDITDKAKIREIIKASSKVPDEFLPKALYQIGTAKRTKDDKMPKGWTSDHAFKVGNTYRLYEWEGIEFAIGDDEKGHKTTASACWMKIYFSDINPN
jgi:hypothetical protein